MRHRYNPQGNKEKSKGLKYSTSESKMFRITHQIKKPTKLKSQTFRQCCEDQCRKVYLFTAPRRSITTFVMSLYCYRSRVFNHFYSHYPFPARELFSPSSYPRYLSTWGTGNRCVYYDHVLDILHSCLLVLALLLL